MGFAASANRGVGRNRKTARRTIIGDTAGLYRSGKTAGIGRAGVALGEDHRVGGNIRDAAAGENTSDTAAVDIAGAVRFNGNGDGAKRYRIP